MVFYIERCVAHFYRVFFKDVPTVKSLPFDTIGWEMSSCTPYHDLCFVSFSTPVIMEHKRKIKDEKTQQVALYILLQIVGLQ